ncbi:hydrogenase maturation protein [Paenibacillus silviterrae]|uniref:hydrogenase maturation protein n=1 Tax=Paenibacillus silviterrae TaxID=3242194 RepID=UPI0025435FFC|nr:hydrogenase maturation protein [Paenibacillus chinjuensis]
MSQRLYVELTDRGHDVKIHISKTEQDMTKAVSQINPELIIAPFMKTIIPESIWKKHTCLVVHPGIKGDRGPYSLDWAIMNAEDTWGVTLLQANEVMDGGDIWSSSTFSMKEISKSHLYRNEVTQAAVNCVLQAIDSIESGTSCPEPLDYSNPDIRGKAHPCIVQNDRKLDWSGPTEEIFRKIRAADSQPGVLDEMFGEPVYLFGAHVEDFLRGEPGEILGYRDGAICRATGEGAIWVTHLKKKGSFKLPATLAMQDRMNEVPDVSLSPLAQYKGRTYREIYYEEKDQVGYIHFQFYNGAMSTEQCNRLRNTLAEIKKSDVKVIVLMSGTDFWSNGIHLNVIEHAQNPADESWANIHAMNDLIREIILTPDQLVISAIQGNAGAGGVILALAADYVYARNGVVLNPHYKKMGGLYGSEYWTYLLPRWVGRDKAMQLTEECMPISTTHAKSIGLIDDNFEAETFGERVTQIASELACHSEFDKMLFDKDQNRERDEQIKPLEQYRKEELDRMWVNFYGEDPSYHKSRHQFVYKISCAATESVNVPVSLR